MKDWQELLGYVSRLSETDQKTLTEKTLKATEELGELARVVLPYDNAFATTHRFVTRAQIIEEVADVVITALSIGYNVGMTSEEFIEMAWRKAVKWDGLQVKDGRALGPLPFEIHVTVREADVDQFKVHCQEIGVKPLLLDLHTSGGVIKDMQTSSVHTGTNRSAYEECLRIANTLGQFGYDVVRQKIETVPWHPAAPRKTANGTPVRVMPPDCYFECHFAVVLPENDVPALRKFVELFDAKVSRNVFKRLDGGDVKMMVTFRAYDGVYEDFENKKEELESWLTRKWTVERTITEFSVYDTKLSHDAAWISKS